MSSSTELEVDITKTVPKLKGDSNFSIWVESLEIALKAKDPIYWNILRGITSTPQAPEFYPENLEEVVQMYNIPTNDPRGPEHMQEHIARNESLRDSYDDERKKWQMANFAVLSILRSTLDAGPATQIAGLRDVRDAWCKIARVYSRTGAQFTIRLWGVWVSTIYKSGGNTEMFLRRFRENLQELRGVTKISEIIEIMQFMHAVSGAPEIFPFINQVMLAQQDMATSSAATIYNHFLHYTTQCRTQTFQTHTTSVDKGKGKSECGRGGSSHKGGHHSSGNSHPKADEDKNTIWCTYHDKWGSHFPSDCRLKNNTSNQTNNRGNNTRGRPARSRGTGGRTLAANATTYQQPPAQQAPAEQTVNIDDDTLWANHTDLHIENAPPDEGSVMFVNHINLSTNSTTTAIDDERQPIWMLDSGCSHTMTHMADIFTSFTPMKLPVSSATGQHFWTKGYGEVQIALTSPDGKPIGSMHIQNTWLAPDLAHNLISIRQLARMGIKTVFDESENAQLLQNGQVMAHGTTLKNHYYLCTPTEFPKAEAMPENVANATVLHSSETKPISVTLAHRRTAHTSECKLRNTAQKAVGFHILKGNLSGPCEPCLMEKGHKAPLGHRTRHVNLHPGDIIATDVCGPFRTRGYGGGKYFLTFTDLATHYCWVFIIKEHSKVLEKFKVLDNFLKVQHNITIKKVQADGAGEHGLLSKYLITTGRVWGPVPRYSAALNSTLEIKNRHILEPLISVMFENKLPMNLWEHLVLAVVFIQNRLVHDTIGTTPYEALQGVQPDLSKLRALGCRCWYLVPKEVRSSKLSPHSAQARFIGYSEGFYKVYDIETKKIHHTRDVMFDERPLIEHVASSHNFDESQLLLDSPHNKPLTVPEELLSLCDEDNTETGAPPDEPQTEEPLRPLGRSNKPSWMLEYERTGVLPPINKADS